HLVAARKSLRDRTDLVGSDHLSGTRLLEPQHEFLDFAGTCLSEASVSRDDTKAALLEDALRRDVVVGDAGVERARRIDSEERLEGAVLDPLPPVGPAHPVRDLALAGVSPRANRSGDFAVDDDGSVDHRLVGS